MTTRQPASSDLMERLDAGPVICAEGYLFELERRGYLQAGPYVPEVVIEHPDLVRQLHREFVHAGSDVVEAFTYYAHREKLTVIGREQGVERLNRDALAIASEVANESGALLAGNICNTNIWDPDSPGTRKAARAMFEEQVGWAVDADVDFIIGETFEWVGEAMAALETIKAARQARGHYLFDRAEWKSVRRGSGGRMPAPGRRGCGRGRIQLFLWPRDDAAVGGRGSQERLVSCGGVAGALSDNAGAPELFLLQGPGPRRLAGWQPLSHRARFVRLRSPRVGEVRARSVRHGRALYRCLLRGGSASHSLDSGDPRTHAARQPVLARHVEARVTRYGLDRHRGLPAVRRLAERAGSRLSAARAEVEKWPTR